MTRVIRVLIADDQAVVRESIQAALEGEDDIEVVAEASDGDEAVTEACRTEPDVALIDLRMPRADGLGAVQGIAEECPGTKAVALSILNERQCVREVFNLGGYGYIVKGQGDARLADVVREVAGGIVYVDPLVRKQLASQLALAGKDRLSEEDERLLGLVVEGMSDAQIAERLGCSAEDALARIEDALGKLETKEPVQKLAVKIRLEGS